MPHKSSKSTPGKRTSIVAVTKGKRVRYERRPLANGKMAYYRDGRRWKGRYAARIVNGLIAQRDAGRTPSIGYARGHTQAAGRAAFRSRFDGKFPSQATLDREKGSFGKWAQHFWHGRATTLYDYYARVLVWSEDETKPQYDRLISEEELAERIAAGDLMKVPATFRLVNPDDNNAGLGRDDVIADFDALVDDALHYAGAHLAGTIEEAVMEMWHHRIPTDERGPAAPDSTTLRGHA